MPGKLGGLRCLATPRLLTGALLALVVATVSFATPISPESLAVSSGWFANRWWGDPWAPQGKPGPPRESPWDVGLAHRSPRAVGRPRGGFIRKHILPPETPAAHVPEGNTLVLVGLALLALPLVVRRWGSPRP
jgi:hypothetical protein